MTHAGNSGSDPHQDQASRFVAELRAALATAGAAEVLQSSSPPDELLDLIVRTAALASSEPNTGRDRVNAICSQLQASVR